MTTPKFTVHKKGRPGEIIAVSDSRDDALELSRRVRDTRVSESGVSTPRVSPTTPTARDLLDRAQFETATPSIVQRVVDKIDSIGRDEIVVSEPSEITPSEITVAEPSEITVQRFGAEVTEEDLSGAIGVPENLQADFDLEAEPTTPFGRDAERLREINDTLSGDALEVRERIAVNLGLDPDVVQAHFEDAAGRYPDSRRVMEEINRLRDEAITLRNKYESSYERIQGAAAVGIDLAPVGAGVEDRPQNLGELARSLGVEVEELPDANSAEFVNLVQSELGLNPQQTAALVRDLTFERIEAERIDTIRQELGLPADATIEDIKAEIARLEAIPTIGPESATEDFPTPEAPRIVSQEEFERYQAAMEALTAAGVVTDLQGQPVIDVAQAREMGLEDSLRAVGLTDAQINADLIAAQRRQNALEQIADINPALVTEDGRVNLTQAAVLGLDDLLLQVGFSQRQISTALIERETQSRLALGEASQAYEAAQPAPPVEPPIITTTTLERALADAELRLERASLAGSSAPGPVGPTAQEYQRVQEIEAAIQAVNAGELSEERALLNLGLARQDIPSVPRTSADFNTFEQIIAALIPFDMERPTREGMPILPPEEWSPDAELRLLYQEASDFNYENFPGGQYAPATWETVIEGPNPENLTVEEVQARIEEANQKVAGLDARLEELQIAGAPNIGLDPETNLPVWIGPPEAFNEYLSAIEEHSAAIESYNETIASLPSIREKPTTKTAFDQISETTVSLTPVLGTVIAADSVKDNWEELNAGEKVVGTAGVGISAAADIFILAGLVTRPLATVLRSGIGRATTTRNPVLLRQTIRAQRGITDNFVSAVREGAPDLVPTSRAMMDDFASHATLAATRESTATRLVKAQELLDRTPLPDGSDILNVRVLSDRVRVLDQALAESRMKLQASSSDFGEAVRRANIGQDTGLNYQSGQLTSLNESINSLPGNMVRLAESTSARQGITETVEELQRQLITANRLLMQAESRYARATTISLDDAQRLSALRQNKVAIEGRLKDALLGDVEALNKERLIVQNDLTILRKAREQGRELTEREVIETQRFRSVGGIPAAEQRLEELSTTINRQIRSWDDMLGKPLSHGGEGRVLAPDRPMPPQIRGELGGFTRSREVPFLSEEVLPSVAIGGLGSFAGGPVGEVATPTREPETLPDVAPPPERVPFDPFTAPTVPEPTTPFPSPTPRVSPSPGPRQVPEVSPFPEVPPPGPYVSPVQEPSRRFAPERPPAPFQEPGNLPAERPIEFPTEAPIESPAEAPAEQPLRRELPITPEVMPRTAPATLPVMTEAMRIQTQIREAAKIAPAPSPAARILPAQAVRPTIAVEPSPAVRPPVSVPPPVSISPPEGPRPPRRRDTDFEPPEFDESGRRRENLQVVGINRGVFDTTVNLVTGETLTFTDLEQVPETGTRQSFTPLRYGVLPGGIRRIRWGALDLIIDARGVRRFIKAGSAIPNDNGITVATPQELAALRPKPPRMKPIRRRRM